MNFNKKKMFIKKNDKVQIISGSKKGLIGRVIKINTKNFFIIINLASNFNLFKIKLIKELKVFETYNIYSEKDYLYSQSINNIFQALNEKCYKKEIKLLNCISNVKKKVVITKNKLTKYFLTFVTNYSNVKIFNKNINLLSNLKQKKFSQSKFLFLRKLNLIECE